MHIEDHNTITYFLDTKTLHPLLRNKTTKGLSADMGGLKT